MTHPKFIISSKGFLRLGQVRLHKNLLQEGESCYGGGFYEFDYVSNRLLLSGQSYDFGKPRWNWVDVLKVPAAYRNLRIVYRYDDVTPDFCVSDEMQIEYIP